MSDMSDSVAELEKRRSAIVERIGRLGDLRPGSVSATYGRCGKQNCRCHQPDQPGHGPNFRLTYKVDGKTITETLPNSAAVRKAEREVAEFRSFQKLSHELLQVNRRICQLRVAAKESPTASRSGIVPTWVRRS